MKRIVRRLENECEQELAEVTEQMEKQGINEADFMQLVIDEVNSKTLNIIGIFNEDMVRYVRNFVNNLWYYEDDTHRPLYINITSRGGEVDSLFAILDMLDDCKEEWNCNIITKCDGYAHSCGFALWCYGNERYMGKYGELMCHSISYGINGLIQNHEQELKRTKKVQKKLDRVITANTPITQQQLNKWYKKGADVFMDREEALKLGLLTIEE